MAQDNEIHPLAYFTELSKKAEKGLAARFSDLNAQELLGVMRDLYFSKIVSKVAMQICVQQVQAAQQLNLAADEDAYREVLTEINAIYSFHHADERPADEAA